MCDLKAYVASQGTEELVLEAVNLVRTEGEAVLLRNLFGEERTVTGRIREVSLTKNRVVIESADLR